MALRSSVSKVPAAIAMLGWRTWSERAQLRIETLILEPDQDRFSLLFRGAVPCEKRALRVEEVVVTLRSLEGVAS